MLLSVFLLDTSNWSFLHRKWHYSVSCKWCIEVEISIQVLKHKACHCTPLYPQAPKVGGGVHCPPPPDGTAHAFELWCCLEVRGDYQNCSVLNCVLKLCTVMSTLRWAVLSSLDCVLCHWAHFTVPRFIRVYVCRFLCLSCHTACVLHYCSMLGWTWWDWSLILRTFLQCFDGVRCQSLGHLLRKNPSSIGSIMCLVGR